MSEEFSESPGTNESFFRTIVPGGWFANNDTFIEHAPGTAKQMVAAANSQHGPVSVQLDGEPCRVEITDSSLRLVSPDGSTVVYSLKDDASAGVFNTETLFNLVTQLLRGEVGEPGPNVAAIVLPTPVPAESFAPLTSSASDVVPAPPMPTEPQFLDPQSTDTPPPDFTGFSQPAEVGVGEDAALASVQD